jgi:hypothetical protein
MNDVSFKYDEGDSPTSTALKKATEIGGFP